MLSDLAALVLLTPLILLCLVGVRDLRPYMQHALVPARDREQVILLLGGIGWVELGILFGVAPNVLQLLHVGFATAELDRIGDAIGAFFIISGVVLIRSGKAEHPLRTALIYTLAMALALAVGVALILAGGA